MRDLKSRGNPQRLLADFEDYLNGFSPNVQDILGNFKFRNQLTTLSRADAIGTLINKFLDPDIDLSPAGIDNHAMGTVFEELVRKFNEDNNEEVGEHWTPRDAVRLMANLVFLPIEEQLKSGLYLLYDCACGTGGMLTVAEETLAGIAARRGLQLDARLHGQEINPETFAICKADMLLKGEGENAEHIVGGAEGSVALSIFRFVDTPWVAYSLGRDATGSGSILENALNATEPDIVSSQGDLNIQLTVIRLTGNISVCQFSLSVAPIRRRYLPPGSLQNSPASKRWPSAS